MIKKQILILNMTLLTLAGYVHAQPAGNVRNQGYLIDNTGSSSAIKAPSSGVCVRTTEWTPGRSIAECDPELTAKPSAPKPVVAAAPAPKPVVAPPPPAPPPPKPTIQKLSLSTDALFDFDKAILKLEGMKKLNDLITELKGSQYDSIVATGHTDRLGSTDYNQRLSQRRAEAVQKYLVAQGLDAAKINAVGKGKSQPVTKPADCKGKGRSTLHTCLQPDRRVDIEVSGSKTIQIPAAPVAKPATK